MNNTLKIKPIIKKKKYVLNEDQAILVKEAFDLFDLEKSGTVDLHELKLSLKAFGFKMKKTELLELVASVSQDSTAKARISYNEFLEIVTEKFSQRDPKEEISLAFDLFDSNKSGKLNFANLKKAIKEMGENISDNDLKAIIQEFDGDQDGEITKADFLKIMEEYYMD